MKAVSVDFGLQTELNEEELDGLDDSFDDG